MAFNKKLGFILILAFLSAQVFALWHMASYGFEKHQHNNHVCEIYLLCEQNKTSYIPAGVVIPACLSFVILAVVFVSHKIAEDRLSYSIEPRAPPVVSL